MDNNQFDDPLPFQVMSIIRATNFKSSSLDTTHISTCHVLLLLLTTHVQKSVQISLFQEFGNYCKGDTYSHILD